MSKELLSYEGRDLEVMSFAQNYHTWIRDYFKPYLGKDVSEVGAGSGNFSSLILETHPDELIAVEPSRQMFPLLKKKFEGDKRVNAQNTFFGDVSARFQEHFDSVVYINVLEHIEDDEQELRYVHQSLKTGGHVCIFVPALPSLYSATDKKLGHFRRYLAHELRERLVKAEFEVVKLSYFDVAGIIPWFVFMKLLKKELSGGDVALYDTLVVPLMRFLESIVPVPVGKNLIAVGKKV